MAKKKFSELSPKGRATASTVIVVSVALVIAAERDLSRRPGEEVRGSKLLWRLICLNGLGALAYLRWGRRPAT